MDNVIEQYWHIALIYFIAMQIVKDFKPHPHYCYKFSALEIK